jgi:hypothetical protein
MTNATASSAAQQGTRIADSEGIDARFRQHEYLSDAGLSLK